jgi:hypothetical protein
MVTLTTTNLDVFEVERVDVANAEPERNKEQKRPPRTDGLDLF